MKLRLGSHLYIFTCDFDASLMRVKYAIKKGSPARYDPPGLDAVFGGSPAPVTCYHCHIWLFHASNFMFRPQFARLLKSKPGNKRLWCPHSIRDLYDTPGITGEGVLDAAQRDDNLPNARGAAAQKMLRWSECGNLAVLRHKG